MDRSVMTRRPQWVRSLLTRFVFVFPPPDLLSAGLEAVVLSSYISAPWDDMVRFPLRFKTRSGGHSYWHIVLAVQCEVRAVPVRCRRCATRCGASPCVCASGRRRARARTYAEQRRTRVETA